MSCSSEGLSNIDQRLSDVIYCTNIVKDFKNHKRDIINMIGMREHVHGGVFNETELESSGYISVGDGGMIVHPLRSNPLWQLVHDSLLRRAFTPASGKSMGVGHPFTIAGLAW